MLQPKNRKYKKAQKGNLKKKNSAIFLTEQNKNFTAKLIAQQTFRLSAKQLETTRVSIMRKLKRGVTKLDLKIFPNLPVTKKPNEVRMGKGKGAVEFWGVKVYKGTTIFEIHGTNHMVGETALLSGAKKLPMQTTIKSLNQQIHHA